MEDDGDAVVGSLRQLRDNICQLLQSKEDVSQLDEEELKLYSCLFLPIIDLQAETNDEYNQKLLIGVKPRNVEVCDGKALVNEMLL